MPSFKAFAEQTAKARELQGQAAAAKSPAPGAAPLPANKARTTLASKAASAAPPAKAGPPPSASPAGDEEKELKVGAPVRVCNLMARPELNGLEGVLTAYDAERVRWQVELKSGGAKLFKPGNLERFVPERNAMDVLKGRAKLSPAEVAAQHVSAQQTGEDAVGSAAVSSQATAAAAAEAHGAAPAQDTTATAQTTASPVPTTVQDPARTTAVAPPMTTAAAPAGAFVTPAPASTKAVDARRPTSVAAQDGVDAHAASGSKRIHIYPASEDDDEAFFKSIEQCLKECDVMWDDY